MAIFADRRQGFNSSLAFKAPCRIATTANITSLAGFQTIDGVLPVDTDTEAMRRILVKDQTDAAENGIYLMVEGAWERAKDFDSQSDFVRGTRLYAHSGSTQSGGYVVSSSVPAAFNLGEDDIEFGLVTLADYTANQFLELIKTVDGAGSGLDADTLDGQSSAFYSLASVSGTAAAILASLLTVDGSGSGLDADTLDGLGPASAGQCRLVYVSSTEIRLDRRNGSYLWINGAIQQIPSSGPTLSNSGLSASTAYYIYAYMNSTTMTLEASTTVPATSSSDGTQIKTGDATRALVGRIITNGSSQFFGGNYSTANGVVSWFNPERIVRVEQIIIGSVPGSVGIDVADNSSTYGFLTATTASNIASWQFVGTARIKFARFRCIMGSNNSGNKARLVHSDDGPANITQIAEVVSDGSGNPVNSAADVTSSLVALQDGILDKNIGVQVSCVNGSVFTVYKMALELVYDTEPW